MINTLTKENRTLRALGSRSSDGGEVLVLAISGGLDSDVRDYEIDGWSVSGYGFLLDLEITEWPDARFYNTLTCVVKKVVVRTAPSGVRPDY